MRAVTIECQEREWLFGIPSPTFEEIEDIRLKIESNPPVFGEELIAEGITEIPAHSMSDFGFTRTTISLEGKN